MTDANEELGVLRRLSDCLQATLVRTFEHDQRSIWQALTDPEKLVQWLAPGALELRVGGAAKLNFVDSGIVVDSVVTACEAPRLIEYSWSGPGQPSRPVRWETQAEGGATRLTLTVTMPEGEDIARACAGWEAHLMMLMAALEGVPIKFPFERFKTTREAYKAKLAALS